MKQMAPSQVFHANHLCATRLTEVPADIVYTFIEFEILIAWRSTRIL